MHRVRDIPMNLEFKTPKPIHLRHALMLGAIFTSPLWFATPQALAVALTGGIDITNITTTTSTGTPSSITGVKGGSTSYTSTYNLNFQGQTNKITSFQTGGGTGTGTVNQSAPATFSIRRNPTTDDRQTVWYQGTVANNTFTLNAGGPQTEQQALSSNNTFVGSDNLFTNTNNPQNNNASIERLDFVLGSSLQAGNTTGFTIFERGVNTAHDGFKIAAITGVDTNNKPTSYGTLYDVTAGSWGQTQLASSTDYYVLNNSAANNTGTPQNPAADINNGQSIGGLFVSTNNLVSTGRTIYGYSLFGADTVDPNASTTDACTSLVDWTNASCFPTTTTDSDGGLDLVGANLGAVSYKVPFGFSPGMGILALGAWGAVVQLKSKIQQRKSSGSVFPSNQ